MRQTLYPRTARHCGYLVGLLASGHTEAEILKAYPYLQDDDLREALAYAVWRVEEIEVPIEEA